LGLLHARRYKWLSSAAGQKFGGIYKLQRQGMAFATPEQWLHQLGIYSATQQSAADYMSVSHSQTRYLHRFSSALLSLPAC
jgi:hypothetical protein